MIETVLLLIRKEKEKYKKIRISSLNQSHDRRRVAAYDLFYCGEDSGLLVSSLFLLTTNLSCIWRRGEGVEAILREPLSYVFSFITVH